MVTAGSRWPRSPAVADGTQCSPMSSQDIRALPDKPAFNVALTRDATIGASGHIREIAPR